VFRLQRQVDPLRVDIGLILKARNPKFLNNDGLACLCRGYEGSRVKLREHVARDVLLTISVCLNPFESPVLSRPICARVILKTISRETARVMKYIRGSNTYEIRSEVSLMGVPDLQIAEASHQDCG
jgi:hypothetical protein